MGGPTLYMLLVARVRSNGLRNRGAQERGDSFSGKRGYVGAVD